MNPTPELPNDIVENNRCGDNDWGDGFRQRSGMALVKAGSLCQMEMMIINWDELTERTTLREVENRTKAE